MSNSRNAILEEVRQAMVKRSNTYSDGILTIDTIVYEIERLKVHPHHFSSRRTEAMSIFDAESIEAAAKAALGSQQNNPPDLDWMWKDMPPQITEAWLKFQRVAFTAAEASLRERGKLRDGQGYVSARDKETWIASDGFLPASQFTVAIIKVGENI